MHHATKPTSAASTSPADARPAWAQRAPIRMLRIGAVCEVTGLSKATIYRLAGEGKFPAGIKLSERATAWPSLAVMRWLDERMGQVGQAAGDR